VERHNVPYRGTICGPAARRSVVSFGPPNTGCARKFVFPGNRNGTYFTGIQKPWQRIRLNAGLPDVRIHDLRHCFASTAVAHGESLYLVGAVLGHRTTSTTQRYAHLAMQPILDSANRTSCRLAALMQHSIEQHRRNEEL